MINWRKRQAELERVRLVLHALSDAAISNLIDTGDEGGAIREGELPPISYFLETISQAYEGDTLEVVENDLGLNT